MRDKEEWRTTHHSDWNLDRQMDAGRWRFVHKDCLMTGFDQTLSAPPRREEAVKEWRVSDPCFGYIQNE